MHNQKPIKKIETFNEQVDAAFVLFEKIIESPDEFDYMHNGVVNIQAAQGNDIIFDYYNPIEEDKKEEGI